MTSSINLPMQSDEQPEQDFTPIVDTRTKEEVLKQSAQAQQIHQNNMKIFNIELTKKQSVEYQPSKLIRVEFENGWYVNITDNEYPSENVFLTIHGAPGDHREWAGLEKQMEGYCRWINVVFPGFDGQDERRGDYSGSVSDFSKLLIMLLENRKVSKIFYAAHSMGTYIASYFIKTYPQYIKGYINITGLVNMWYTGIMTFVRTVVLESGFGLTPYRNARLKLANNDEYRQKLYSKFLDRIKDIYFGPIPFPKITITQFFAFIKLMSSSQSSYNDYFQYNKKIPILRILIYGKNDPLHQDYKCYQAIYSVSRGYLAFHRHPQNAKLISTMKKELEETIWREFRMEIEAEKLQQYFCFYFEGTGHNAHKRRPKELQKIFRVYIVVMNVMEKYKQLIGTKL